MAFDEMLNEASREIASKGRFGDDYLLHVSGSELEFLDSIGAITFNPETGLPEAFSLNSVLNPAGALMGGLFSNKPPPEVPQLETLANNLSQGSNTLIPSVTTGNLPAGAEMRVNNAVQDQIQSIKSKYAQLGMTGSTPEAQEIAQAQARGQAMAFEIADQLTQTGIKEAGLSANIFEAIMKAQVEQDSSLQGALANFAGAASKFPFGSLKGLFGGGAPAGDGQTGASETFGMTGNEGAAAGAGVAADAAVTDAVGTGAADLGASDLLAGAAVLA